MIPHTDAEASSRNLGITCLRKRILPDSRPADGDPELERPALLDGEEEPHDDPEEEVEDGGDHAREHGAIKGSLAEDKIGVV